MISSRRLKAPVLSKTEVFDLEVDEGGIAHGSEILVDRGSKPMLEDILALLVNVNLSVKCK